MKYYFLFIVVISFQMGFSQKIDYCGTIAPSDEEIRQFPYYNNSRYLSEVLQRQGYDIPKDYFEKVDNRGYYDGRRPKLKNFKKGRNPDGNNSGGRVEYVNYNQMYYLPVKFWVYGTNTATQGMMDDVLLQTQRFFRQSEFNVEIYYKETPTTVIGSNYEVINSDAEFLAMIIERGHSDALNVHIVQELPDGAIGTARFKDNALAIVAENDEIGLNGTLAHEFGHNFNLLHTWDGRCSSGDNDCNNCRQESVSRSRTQGSSCNPHLL